MTTRTMAPGIGIVGLGDTDYRRLHLSSRRGDGSIDKYGLAAEVFGRAVQESGLAKHDIDGLVVGPGLSEARTAEVLGIDPTWTAGRDALGAIIEAAAMIEGGLATCVALIHASDQRSVNTHYGGNEAPGGDEHLAYRYFSPWGLTSQGAIYGLMARRMMARHHITDSQLGQVAVTQRLFAGMNPSAVSQRPLALDEYLAEPYVVDPLRRSDYCLINDGAVAMIVTRVDRVPAASRGRAVELAGFGTASDGRDATSLRPKLDGYAGSARRATEALRRSSGLVPADIDCVQIYDAFSIHVPVALLDFGLCPPDEVGDWLAAGEHGPTGSLPVNTGGGHLAESYLHGWNHAAEAVRQTRGDAGARQVANCRHTQCITFGGGRIKTLILSGRESNATAS